MRIQALISLLSDRHIHSGESLAQQLGVSRTAVWKQVRKAQDEGYVIETIRGRGYRLLSSVDLLEKEAVLADLAPELRSAVHLTVLDEVDSTNAEVLRRWPDAGSAMPVCLADCQTAGRGRRGHAWQSPKGENLYLSLGLTFHGGFALLDGLSLVLGVAVADTLEQLGATNVGLIWPNDIFIGERKLGGILVELQGELQEGIVQVIVGIGVNVHMTRAELVDQPWTSLAAAFPDRSWGRNQLAAALIQAVQACTSVFARQGFHAFRPAWQARDIHFGKSLRARQGQLEGVGAGIDDAGNYLLRTDDGLVPVRSGEISLRVVS